MTIPYTLAELPIRANQPNVRSAERITEADVQSRSDDVESWRGLHVCAIVLRVMSGLLLLVMVLQVINGLSGAVEISYGVLAAEAIRLVIVSALLWGAGDYADLSVTSHRDLRAIRILLESGARDST